MKYTKDKDYLRNQIVSLLTLRILKIFGILTRGFRLSSLNIFKENINNFLMGQSEFLQPGSKTEDL